MKSYFKVLKYALKSKKKHRIKELSWGGIVVRKQWMSPFKNTAKLVIYILKHNRPKAAKAHTQTLDRRRRGVRGYIMPKYEIKNKGSLIKCKINSLLHNTNFLATSLHGSN